jgi:hypothetical protein
MYFNEMKFYCAFYRCHLWDVSLAGCDRSSMPVWFLPEPVLLDAIVRIMGSSRIRHGTSILIDFGSTNRLILNDNDFRCILCSHIIELTTYYCILHIPPIYLYGRRESISRSTFEVCQPNFNSSEQSLRTVRGGS